MLFSIKMRSAAGASHENGGQHISGAERIVSEDMLAQTVQNMLTRARNHERGQADFINIKVNTVVKSTCKLIPLLTINSAPVLNHSGALQYAAKCLLSAGVSENAIDCAFKHLDNLAANMRGALLLNATDGSVIPVPNPARGIRVSNMDAEDSEDYQNKLHDLELYGSHVHEALVLASKVASCPGIVAELCISDDPGYTTGYVADAYNYYRISNIKKLGSCLGGRVFFTAPDADIAAIIQYLEKQPVLVSTQGGVKIC